MPTAVTGEISLLGESWKPRLPASFVIREEILLISAQDKTHGMRALGAALGVTWGHHNRALKASYSKSNFDPRAYGGEIWDELRALGCSMGDLAEQGNRALNAIALSIPSQEAVEERVGFSDPASSSTVEVDGNADQAGES